ncbi:MAG TPA: precorrin-2 C(20)-methyltransferase [Desulfobacterales bacterium]|nr:precorrin-2 C(20)-methyltransferase [Desulfobacterales bacterium]
MTGTFYVVGVGPGDPELLTLKASRILKNCSSFIVPKSRADGNSTALWIVEQSLSTTDKEIVEIHFPMQKVRMGEAPAPEVSAAWQKAVDAIIIRLKNGQDVAFPTLGDPAIYSTGFYTCQTLLERAPDSKTVIVPGVSSISACAAAANVPLCQGDDMLAVVPATFNNEKLRQVFNTFQTVVLMKLHRVMPRITALLQELDLGNKAVLIEKTAQNEERIIHDCLSRQDKLHYFSTMIVRTK